MVTKNELQRTSKALEVSNKEKADREESANNLQIQSSLTEEEKTKLKKEEKNLRETIAKLEASQTALTKNAQVFSLPLMVILTKGSIRLAVVYCVSTEIGNLQSVRKSTHVPPSVTRRKSPNV